MHRQEPPHDIHGAIFDYIWENSGVIRPCATTFDALVPALDDPEVVDFIWRKGIRRISGGRGNESYFNHIRCVDLLQERNDVDSERIGVIGHSLGGHNAIFVAAFDTRLKVIVASSGWTLMNYYDIGKKLQKGMVDG